MSKNKNGGLDQYGAEPFKQQQFGTAGAEGVNHDTTKSHISVAIQNLTGTILYFMHCKSVKNAAKLGKGSCEVSGIKFIHHEKHGMYQALCRVRSVIP